MGIQYSRMGFIKNGNQSQVLIIQLRMKKRRMTEKEVDSLPSILIQLEGVESGKSCQNTEGLVGNLDENHCNDVLVTVPPRHYLFDYGDSNYSFELHFQHQAGGGIIGANSMQMHDVF